MEDGMSLVMYSEILGDPQRNFRIISSLLTTVSQVTTYKNPRLSRTWVLSLTLVDALAICSVKQTS